MVEEGCVQMVGERFVQMVGERGVRMVGEREVCTNCLDIRPNIKISGSDSVYL